MTNEWEMSVFWPIASILRYTKENETAEKGTRFARCHFRAQKSSFSGPTPSNGHRNGFSLIKIITSRAIQSRLIVNSIFCQVWRWYSKWCGIWVWLSRLGSKIEYVESKVGYAILWNNVTRFLHFNNVLHTFCAVLQLLLTNCYNTAIFLSVLDPDM